MPVVPSTAKVLPVAVQYSIAVEHGLLLLWDAFITAQRQQPPLEILAISLQQLLQAGLSHEELERLVAARLIVFHDGQASATDQSQGVWANRYRQQQTPGGYVLTRRGFFVVCQALCAKGIDADTTGSHQDELQVMVVSSERPKWDGAARELWWRSRLVRRFRHDAANQRLILTAFEEQNWPSRIDDPLPHNTKTKRKLRLRETVKSLNRGQKPIVLRFHTDGVGQGLRWEVESQLSTCSHPLYPRQND